MGGQPAKTFKKWQRVKTSAQCTFNMRVPRDIARYSQKMKTRGIKLYFDDGNYHQAEHIFPEGLTATVLSIDGGNVKIQFDCIKSAAFPYPLNKLCACTAED